MRLAQQDYAQKAYECIINAQIKAEKDKTDYAQQYGRLCHSFPSMVLQNGLLLTVTFFEAKKITKEVYGQFLTDMSTTIDMLKFIELATKNEIGTSIEYLRISKEVLAASVWFKRYAEAILKISVSDANDGEGGTGE